MHTQVSGHGKSTTQEEEGIEEIESDHDKRVESEIVLDRCGNQVEEREHRDDGDKHVIVHNGGVAVERIMDHITNERHNEESPEELPAG